MRNRLLSTALILFALYFVAVYPTEAAELVRSIFTGAVELASAAAESVSEFVRALV